MDLKWVISEEERTRHDALFYSQKPQDRYLSGEQARSLFIRSKLPLPELSKIWKLADVTRNNMLDISEFAVAMHLIQSRLKGTDIPEKLPETLAPAYFPHITVPPLSQEEKEAYEKAFMWKTSAKTGHVDAETACAVLIGSGLSDDVLARIWNLSDINRDGKLSKDEFFVALHLTRFCKQGNSIEGSVNVRAILSQQLTDECYDSKKVRLAEVQTEKRDLLSLKEKLCHEIAGGLDDKSIAEKVQDELNQVERQVYVLEKEENELRRTLQQLKDKTKRESFKPFDRSFLLKRQPTGEDIFSGASKKYWAPLTEKKDVEILKLWSEDEDLSDFGASISEEPSSPPAICQNIRQDQFGRTVIELNKTQESLDSSPSSLPYPPALNGNSNDIEAKNSHTVCSENNDDDRFKHTRTEINALTRNEGESQESSDKELDKKSLDHADKDNKSYSLMNGTSISSPTHPTRNGIFNPETEKQIELQPSGKTGNNNSMFENRTDDEKTGSLQMAAKIDPHSNHSTSIEKDKLLLVSGEKTTNIDLKGSSNTSRAQVEETVHVTMATTAQSSAASRMDSLLLNLEENEGSFGDQTRMAGEAQSSRSPSGLTQEELIPYLLEEKRKKEEERAKQRELDEEMRRKAREETHKQDVETRRIAEQRKALFQEERQRLEHQMSLAQEGQERKKAPLSRTEAGRVIEDELEKQRIREELTRIEIEKIKEKEKVEIEKQKLKHAKKEEHPSVFQNKGLIQTPIFNEKLDAPDGADKQGARFSSKRGSVIDLIDGDGESSEEKKRPVENRSTQEPAFSPPLPQPQLRSQPEHQPVIRRTKDGAKPALNRNPDHRKSIVELEIERQKEREEEVRREAETARRLQAKNQGGDKGLDKKSEEIKMKEQRPGQITETNGVATKIPSVQKKTKKFEKKSEAFKAKDHSSKVSETNGLSGKNPRLQRQSEVETVVQPKKSANVASPPVDEIDALREPVANGPGSQENGLETEKERKRREEKEHLRQMQEEERKRRKAQKEDLERIRKEVDRKEAEEMMRVKLAKEEEKRKQREADRRLAEERDKDSAEKAKQQQHEAASRKTAFVAHKVILEQRVLKALEESKQENTVPKRRASSFDRPSDAFEQDGSLSSETTSDEFTSGGVKLRKASFEKTGAKKDSKEELRKKRHSLNLEHTQPSSVKERAALSTADDVFVKRPSRQENDVTRRVGEQAHSSESKLTKAKSVGDLSFKRSGQSDTVDGLPTFSDSRIQRELEEQRMREEIVKQEIIEREKRHRLEEEKKKITELPAGKKEMSLNDIKRNPLPSKIQIKKPQPSSNRDSLTHSMASHWETMLHSVPDGSEAKDKTDKRKSLIELEREEERRRGEELQKEREQRLLEIRKKEEENQFLKQRKMEQEIEKKRKEKEEKEKRQHRTSAMKSLFENMGSKK